MMVERLEKEGGRCSKIGGGECWENLNCKKGGGLNSWFTSNYSFKMREDAWSGGGCWDQPLHLDPIGTTVDSKIPLPVRMKN